MKMNPEPPNVKDNGMYRTSEAIAALGMDRTSFWRLANSGKINSTANGATQAKS